MTAQPTPIERPLRAVLRDLATTNARLACHHARRREPTPEEDRAWDELETRQTALQQQFREAFYAETGCDWALASRVMPS